MPDELAREVTGFVAARSRRQVRVAFESTEFGTFVMRAADLPNWGWYVPAAAAKGRPAADSVRHLGLAYLREVGRREEACLREVARWLRLTDHEGLAEELGAAGPLLIGIAPLAAHEITFWRRAAGDILAWGGGAGYGYRLEARRAAEVLLDALDRRGPAPAPADLRH